LRLHSISGNIINEDDAAGEMAVGRGKVLRQNQSLCNFVHPKSPRTLCFLAGNSMARLGTQWLRDLRGIFISSSEYQLKGLEVITNSIYQKNGSL
jgi:hypothetical protein